MVAFVILCMLPVALSLSIKVNEAGNGRNRPLFGYGNEFVFQTNEDAGLNGALLDARSEIGRFPGGTPSDYWLWSDGWVNTSSDRSGCSKLPRRPTTVPQLHTYLAKTNQTTILVLNQLQTNLSYQLQGIQAHQAAGTAVSFLELGNEMYDSTRPDVLEAYPQPVDYANKMATWTSAIKRAYPGSLVALVGLANDWDNRTRAWNAQVLQNPVSAQADAATIHLYPGLPDMNVTVDNFSKLLALAFSTFSGYSSYTDATIPSRFRLWVTEWGTWGNTQVLNTWLQGLWHAALVLQLPMMKRIDIILPYCAVCGDPNMPSFTSQYGPIEPVNATDAQWTRTPSGHVYAQIFEAMVGSPALDSLDFDPNPLLDPSVTYSRQLLGLSARSPKGINAIVVANLGGDSHALDLTPLAFACTALQSSVYYPASVADVTRQGLPIADLRHDTGPCADSLSLPPYAIARVYCA